MLLFLKLDIYQGIWGLIAGPLFRTGGIMSSTASDGVNMLLWNLVGMGSIIVWNGVISSLVFGFLNWMGKLRVSIECEEVGLDIWKHDQMAYPECEFDFDSKY